MNSAPRKNFFPRRLHVQVVLIVTFLLIATIGLYAWTTTRAQSENLTRALRDQTFVMAKNIADLSVNYLLTEDFASIETLLNKTAEFSDVLSISVTNKQGALISQVERGPDSVPRVTYTSGLLSPPPGNKPSSVISGDRIIVWHPIVEGAVFGWVKIEYGLRVITDLHRRIWREALVDAVPVVATSIFLLLFFLTRHIRAVKRITEFAKRLKEQRGEIIPVERSSLEVEQLVSALNHTSLKLYEQTSSINEYSGNLERLKQRILLILQSAGEGILGLDLEGKHTFVNPAAAQSLGYGVDELIGRTIYATWCHRTPEGSPGCEENSDLVAALRAGEAHHVDTAFFWRKDNTFFPVSYTTNVIREGGVATGMVVTFKDITERKRAEEALRESEKKYRTLFEQSKDAIMIDNPLDRIIDINPAGIELFGYSSKEEIWAVDIAKDLYDNPGDRERFKQTAASQRFIRDFEVKLKKKNGEHLNVLITATPVYDEAGNITAYQGIFRDVTSQRLLEDQLLHAQKMEAVGRLTGGIAHDFNNILSAVISYIYLLQKKMTSRDPLRTYVNQILITVERAAHLTQGLLAFSRKQISNPRPVDLNEIVGSVAPLLRQVAGEDVELVTALSDEDVTITADSGQMEQVLMNLAANARDAMSAGGRLTIESRSVELGPDFVRIHGQGKPGRYALLSVVDTGSGMDERTRGKIFEPFFTTKEAGKGTGLGLSIVHGIIKQHNGYIDVSSEPGKGTAFNIYLPATGRESGARKPREQEPRGGSELILVADNDDEVRKTTRSVLSESGYRVIEAVNGEDAIEKFRKNKKRIALVLLDVIMPGKNGKQVYDEILKAKPATRVLFTSGYATSIVEERGGLADGMHFIPKPARPNDLLKKVREMLDAATVDRS